MTAPARSGLKPSLFLPGTRRCYVCGATGLTAARKSCPQLAHDVSPRLTLSPHTGHSRPFGRVMNQMSEKKTKPKNPIKRISATPIPVPASHAFRADCALRKALPVWCEQSLALLAPPAMAHNKMIAHQTITTQVIFRQCGRFIFPPNALGYSGPSSRTLTGAKRTVKAAQRLIDVEVALSPLSPGAGGGCFGDVSVLRHGRG